MTRTSYAAIFALVVVVLTAGGITAFRHLDSIARATRVSATAASWPQDSIPSDRNFAPVAPRAADYKKFEAEDAEWRRRNARPYTLSELRARGDGTRSPQQQLQDRVYGHTRRGDRAGAITELERWVTRHPRDEKALLWLARLLNEAGRNNDAIARYRQILAAKQGSAR